MYAPPAYGFGPTAPSNGSAIANFQLHRQTSENPDTSSQQQNQQQNQQHSQNQSQQQHNQHNQHNQQQGLSLHQPHPHHLQQQPQSHQQPPQQSQHMMYNPQQYAANASAHPLPYGGGQQGMMPNSAMAHMPVSAGPGPHALASTYQTPYSSSPYIPNMPTSTAPSNLPPNFMPPTSGASPYPHAQQHNMSMNPQLQAQRMQSHNPLSTPGQGGMGSRGAPFAPGGTSHNTPAHSIPPQQQQFSTPQPQNQTQAPSNPNPQGASNAILTPQTPNFPPGAHGTSAGNNLATPLSPGSEVRERDRVTVLLEINKYLLMEVMRIQAAQAETKKEGSASGGANSPIGTDKEKAEKEKEKIEKAKPASRDYFECMRRLQVNLAYLAAIADRSHKPSSQIPPHPAIMSAPPLSTRPSPSKTSPSTHTSPKPTNTSGDSGSKKEEGGEEVKIEGLDEDHAEALREQYKKLQALFPGVDPRKGDVMPGQGGGQMGQKAQAGNPNQNSNQNQGQNPGQNSGPMQHQNQSGGQMGMQMQGHGQNQGQGQGQGQGQQTQGQHATGMPVGIDHGAQQKMQYDLLRQKMMQAQQHQAQQQQQAQQMMQAQAGGGGVTGVGGPMGMGMGMAAGGGMGMGGMSGMGVGGGMSNMSGIGMSMGAGGAMGGMVGMGMAGMPGMPAGMNSLQQGQQQQGQHGGPGQNMGPGGNQGQR